MWREGVTYMALIVSMPDRRARMTARAKGEKSAKSRYAIVTNNGEVWSGRVFELNGTYEDLTVEMVHEARALVGLSDKPEFSAKEFSSNASSPPEWRLPVEWAKKVVTEPGKTYATEAAKTASSSTFPRSLGHGDIMYTGFELYKKRSAHKLEDLHGVIDDAVAACARAWSWEASGLEVKFHDTAHSYGLAYEPGVGASTGVRKISLNAKLISAYDKKSIWRVVVHELCHHFREERWPRVIDRRHEKHDTIFCRELARVDEAVRADIANNCAFFDDDADASIVAAMPKKVRVKEPVSWAPAAGKLIFDNYVSGKLRLEWSPNKAAGFKWPKEVFAISGESLVAVAKRFTPEEWRSVRVETPLWILPGTPPTSLAELIRYMLSNWPKHMAKLNDYVTSLDGEKR